jgi:hypothetical protein
MKQVEILRLTILEFENLKGDLVFYKASIIKDNKSSLSLVPRFRSRSTYECYNP